MKVREFDLVEQFRDMKLQVVVGEDVIRCNHMTISSDFLRLVKEKQLKDPSFRKIVCLLGTK